MKTKLNNELVTKLNKVFDPNVTFEMKFKGYDIAFKTDKQGNPTLLFFGKKTEKGTIKGERYARRLLKDKKGIVIKDHWEMKGKAT